MPRHHGAGGHGIHQHTGDEEQNSCDQEALLVAHDECPCLLCLFFYRPCGLSCFGGSLGGIPSSLTGALGGGILLFDGLLLLPAGKRIAGKLRIFLQRFLVQDIYISLFQLTLCLGCFAVRLQLVTTVALPTRIAPVSTASSDLWALSTPTLSCSVSRISLWSLPATRWTGASLTP